eukprot:scaffold52612_cov25-Tisochrysis_lutea.AAC.4
MSIERHGLYMSKTGQAWGWKKRVGETGLEKRALGRGVRSLPSPAQPLWCRKQHCCPVPALLCYCTASLLHSSATALPCSYSLCYCTALLQGPFSAPLWSLQSSLCPLGDRPRARPLTPYPPLCLSGSTANTMKGIQPV